MMKQCAVMFFASFCLSASADVTFQANVVDVFHRGEEEPLGQLNLSINDDDFKLASPDNPIFLRITFDHGASLAWTLVDQGQPELSIRSLPIYLAMRLVVAGNDGANISLIAPPEAVSIVRWVAGEAQIWLRFQSGSDQWLTDGNDVFGPSDDRVVWFSLGLGAQTSREQMAQVQEDRRNLSANTRFPEIMGNPGGASSIFCLDLSTSTLQNQGVESLLSIDPIFFDSGVEIGNGMYSAASGHASSVSFGNPVVAAGKARELDVETLSSPVLVEEKGEQVLMRSTLKLDLTTASGSTFLESHLYDGSQVILSIESDTMGFDPLWLRFSEKCGRGIVWGVEGSEIELGDQTLFREIILAWNGGFQELNQFPLAFHAALVAHRGHVPQAIPVTWRFSPVVWEQVSDTRGTDEFFPICRNNPLELASGQWLWQPDPKPKRMISHITKANGDFSTQLSLTNWSQEPEPYTLVAFEADGTLAGEIAAVLDPAARIDWDVATLFGSDLVSHMEIDASSLIHANAVYRADRDTAGPAHIQASDQMALGWVLVPGDWDLVYDGIALVNRGTEAAAIHIDQVGSDGEIVASVIIEESLAPKAKVLYLPRTDFVDLAGASFHIRSDQPTSLIALRGDPDSTFLWENPVFPLVTGL